MSRSRTIRRIAVRRLISLGVLVGICAVVLPLPMTMPVSSDSASEKDPSQPFPCMNRPCGCRTAEQCWKQCCCFTNAEKVAWAKANHVQIPGFVVVAAKKESLSDTKPCCCCSKSKEDTADKQQNKPEKLASAMCGSRRKPDVHVATVVRSHGTATNCSATTLNRLKWVLAVKAAECNGHSVFWLTLPPAVISSWMTLPTEPPVVAESWQSASEHLPMILRDAPVPPPKIG
jgi:hypothetical protein